LGVGICGIRNRLHSLSFYGIHIRKIRVFSLYVTFGVLELLCDLPFDSYGIFTSSTIGIKTNSCTAARRIMILGPVSLLDCVIFVLFLLPNLLVQVGLVQILSLIKVIPFLGTFSFLTFIPRSRHMLGHVDGASCIELTEYQHSNCRTNLFESGTCRKEKRSHHSCRMQASSKTLSFGACDMLLHRFLQTLDECFSPNGSLIRSSASACFATDI
jgi:hypothetical protein